MARIRTIKPEFWQNEDLADVSESARLMAIGLLNLADDEGWFKAHPRLIEAAIFPLTEPSVSTHECLIQLSDIGYITLHEGEDGKAYGQVAKFTDHQKINRPTASKIKGLAKLTEDSLSAHELLTPGKERKGTGKGKEQGKEKTLVPSVEDTPKVDDRKEWFEQIWNAYPKRDGAKGNKAKTFKLCCQIAGTDHGKWGDLWKAVSKYAAWAEASGNAETSMIQQTTTFFGKDKAGYLEDWDVTAKTGSAAQTMSKGDLAMAGTLQTLQNTDLSWLDEVDQ